MENKLLLSNLLYIEEHLSCKNYISEITTGFKYIKFEKLTHISEECTKQNYLLFFLEGKFTISCNRFCNHKFKKGEMILLPKSSKIKIKAAKSSQLLVMIFNVPERACDKFGLQSLTAICENIEYTFSPIEIHYPLMPFLEVLICCLENRMQCRHIHQMMQSELFFLLRGFYEKEQIATLFYPIIGKELSFKDFVIQNYPLVGSIDQLIALSEMGRTSFFVKFKAEFGMSAKQWMMTQLKETILEKVMEPGVCVKQLTTACGFESQAQLYRFFKKYFNCTPKQFIKQNHIKN